MKGWRPGVWCVQAERLSLKRDYSEQIKFPTPSWLSAPALQLSPITSHWSPVLWRTASQHLLHPTPPHAPLGGAQVEAGARPRTPEQVDGVPEGAAHRAELHVRGGGLLPL